jgi:folate-dependent tRNA-U54 methylase TrmFO/GidA
MKKRERYEAMAERALNDLRRWIEAAPLARAA